MTAPVQASATANRKAERPTPRMMPTRRQLQVKPLSAEAQRAQEALSDQ